MGKPVDDLRFCKVLALACAGLNLGVDVATIAVDHDDVEELLTVDIAVLVCDDVGVADLLQQSNFILCVLQVFLTHVSCLHSFDHIVLSFSLVSSEVHLAETPATNCLYCLVYVHLALSINQSTMCLSFLIFSSLQIQMINIYK